MHITIHRAFHYGKALKSARNLFGIFKERSLCSKMEKENVLIMLYLVSSMRWMRIMTVDFLRVKEIFCISLFDGFFQKS